MVVKMEDLFRKEALENFSASSSLNKNSRGIGIRMSVFIFVIALCAAVFMIWLFFGAVYETVSVNGIIWPAKGGGAVYVSSGGMVDTVTVSVGDTVAAGDVIAVIPNEITLSEIEEAKGNGASDAELQELYKQYDKNSLVRSKVSGIVTQITDENVYIPDNGKIAEVAPYDENANNETLIAFISSEQGGLVTLGMEAQVMPDFAPREEYGYIKAYVSKISPYPVTGQYIRENRTELFVSTIDERKNYLQIEITLMPDAQAQSHLKWSNSSSGDIDAPTGTVCGADIVIKKCHPYEWLFT